MTELQQHYIDRLRKWFFETHDPVREVTTTNEGEFLFEGAGVCLEIDALEDGDLSMTLRIEAEN